MKFIVNKHSQAPFTAIKSNIFSSKGISFVLTFTNYYKRFLCFTKNLDCFFHCRWVCKTLWRNWRTTNWPLKKILTVWLKPKDINSTNLFLIVNPALQQPCQYTTLLLSPLAILVQAKAQSVICSFKEPCHYIITIIFLWPVCDWIDGVQL